MKIQPKKSVRMTFSLTEVDKDMIEELLEKGNYMTLSEVVRQAVRMEHKRIFPYYKQKDTIRVEDQREREGLLKLPIKEYIKKVLPGGEIDEREQVVVLVHKQNPALKARVKLTHVKNYASRNEVWQRAGHMLEDE